MRVIINFDRFSTVQKPISSVSEKGLYNRTCLRIHQAGEPAGEILLPPPRQAADSRPLAMATKSTGCYRDNNRLVRLPW